MTPRALPSHELVERALAAADDRDCAVLVTETSRVNLRWALGGLTTNGATTARSTTAIVTGRGGGVGVLTRSGEGADDVAGLVAHAAAAADRSAPAEDAAPFADPAAGPGTPGAADGWERPAEAAAPSALGPVARVLGELFGRARAEGRTSSGFALQERTTTWLATSAGLLVRHDQPTGILEVTGTSADRTRSTWVGCSGRDLADVDLLALDDDVARRLAWQHRRVDLPPGRYETVLPPSAVADLMISYLWSSDARSAAEGRSAFSRPGGGTRLGDRLTPFPLTLRSDPAAGPLTCAPCVVTASSSPLASVFDNGLAVGPVTWLDRGVVGALPGTRHGSRLAGVPFRPLPGNLLVSTDDPVASTLDLVRDVRDGLLLTCLWYIREVDPATLLLTGLTRDGVYRIEGGEIVGAVTNFRWNESPVGLLGRITGAGPAEVTLGREFGEWFPRTSAPALRVADVNMSTTSAAS